MYCPCGLVYFLVDGTSITIAPCPTSPRVRRNARARHVYQNDATPPGANRVAWTRVLSSASASENCDQTVGFSKKVWQKRQSTTGIMSVVWSVANGILAC